MFILILFNMYKRHIMIKADHPLRLLLQDGITRSVTRVTSPAVQHLVVARVRSDFDQECFHRYKGTHIRTQSVGSDDACAEIKRSLSRLDRIVREENIRGRSSQLFGLRLSFLSDSSRETASFISVTRSVVTRWNFVYELNYEILRRISVVKPIRSFLEESLLFLPSVNSYNILCHGSINRRGT